MTKILVCGGRAFQDKQFIYKSLDECTRLHGPIELLMHGGAEGADKLAYMWAQLHEIPSRQFSANWAKYGRAAGPLRNQYMLDEGKPDLVVAFPGGRGTEDMMQRTLRAGITLIPIRP